MNSLRQFPYLIVITVAAAMALMLTAYKAHQNGQRLANFRERDLKREAAYELGREVNSRVITAFKAQLSIDAFAEEFGVLTELTDTTDPKYAEMTHTFFHDGSQRLFYLRFVNDRLMGFKSHHGSGDVDTGVVLETPAFRATESVRTTVLSGGLIAWVLCLVAGLCMRRFRRYVAVLLPALSVLCGLCWLLAPNYIPTLDGISSNDNLALFGFMLIGSLVISAAIAMRPGRGGIARHEMAGRKVAIVGGEVEWFGRRNEWGSD